MKLTSKMIGLLSGKPIRLTSEFANGKLLSVSSDGELSLEEPDLSGEYDQFWRLIPVEKGFLISSSVGGYVICYDRRSGSISISGESAGDDCVWKVGSGGELYQKIEGGERYLWTARGKLYATLDGYLAENWIPLDVGDSLPGIYSKKRGMSKVFVAILVAVSILLLCAISRGGKPDGSRSSSGAK